MKKRINRKSKRLTVKASAVLLCLLALFSPAVIAVSAITVEKDGQEYILNSPTPATGDCKALVIRVGFADYDVDDEDFPADSEEDLLSYFDGSEDSLTAFYKNSSYGKLNIYCDRVYSYNAEYERSYYDSCPEEFIKDAIDYLGDEINLDDYDSDGDGILDFVSFDFAGPTGEWGSTWWSHVDSRADIEVRDKLIRVYSLLKDNVNVYIHEFGHILGAVDYYSYSDGNPSCIMSYDMMCSNEGDHDGFTKWSYGWLDDDDIAFVDKSAGDTTVELSPIETTAEGKKIAVVAPRIDRSNGFLDEYFLVEYDSGELNSAGVFEEFSFEPGFRIFHINARACFGDDGTAAFIMNNNSARLNLIHNVKNELYADSDWALADNFFREGDSLTAGGYPNTGLTVDGVYNGMFTGICFTDFVTGENPSFRVTFSDEYIRNKKPALTISGDILKSYVRITVEADQPIVPVTEEFLEGAGGLQPYLIDVKGNKLALSADNTDLPANQCFLVYSNESYPYIQPETEYTLVIPYGFFRAAYNQPVDEARQQLKTGFFLSPNEIGLFPDGRDEILISNPFAVSDGTYGLITFHRTSGGKFTFTEYDRSGDAVTSAEFDSPVEFDDESFYQNCSVLKLFDGSFGLALMSNKGMEFVKIDRNGNALSGVIALGGSVLEDYETDEYSVKYAPYKNGMCAIYKSLFDDSHMLLSVDFQNEPEFTVLDTDSEYGAVDSDAYFIKTSDISGASVSVYDSSGNLLFEIGMEDECYGVFGENGNITVLYSYYDRTAAEVYIYTDTYSKDGKLLEHRQVSGDAMYIQDIQPDSRVTALDGGYVVEYDASDTQVVLTYDKDWNNIGILRMFNIPRLAFAGDYAVYKTQQYIESIPGMRTALYKLELGLPQSGHEETSAPGTEETTADNSTVNITEQTASVPAANNNNAKSSTSDSANGTNNGGTVKTGEGSLAVIFLLALIAATGFIYYIKRNNQRG